MDKAERCRTICCTPGNLAEMQTMVKQWPELHDTIKDLQRLGLFPGLRSLTITLTGDDQHLAGGLDTVNRINAARAL